MSEETDQIIVTYYDLVKRWERASGLMRNENSAGPTPEAAALYWRGMENRMIVAEEKVRRIAEWTHQYGKQLCPGSRPDSYGEGVGAAKEWVASVLRFKGGSVETGR